MQANSIVPQNPADDQTYRAGVVADALRQAADAAGGGPARLDLVTALAVALYNLPPALKPALLPALASDPR